MNGKQRRIKQTQGQVEPLIVLGDRSCTVKEAGAVATRELHLGNFQAAADLYSLILAKLPDYGEAYSNRGVARHQMKRFEEALADYDRAMTMPPPLTTGVWFYKDWTGWMRRSQVTTGP